MGVASIGSQRAATVAVLSCGDKLGWGSQREGRRQGGEASVGEPCSKCPTKTLLR